MKLKLFHVDAFTDQLFGGNPAAVCPLEEWLPKELMQKIAAENNLSETAFFVPEYDTFDLKWFTPTVEIDLCGHATLASGHVLYQHYNHTKPEISFTSNSGLLSVRNEGDWLTLDFPTDELKPAEMPQLIVDAFRKRPLNIFKGKANYLAIFSSRQEIENLEPDFKLLSQVQSFGVIVTAPGNEVDFVSRYFAPGSGIDEDPATGSSHTSLIPYWSNELKKKELIARQLSKRGGYFKCKLKGERVEISGKAVTYLVGDIEV